MDKMKPGTRFTDTLDAFSSVINAVPKAKARAIIYDACYLEGNLRAMGHALNECRAALLSNDASTKMAALATVNDIMGE